MSTSRNHISPVTEIQKNLEKEPTASPHLVRMPVTYHDEFVVEQNSHLYVETIKRPAYVIQRQIEQVTSDRGKKPGLIFYLGAAGGFYGYLQGIPWAVFTGKQPDAADLVRLMSFPVGIVLFSIKSFLEWSSLREHSKGKSKEEKVETAMNNIRSTTEISANKSKN